MTASIRPARRAGAGIRLAAAGLAALLAAGAAAALAPASAAHAADDDVTWTVRTAANDFGADRTAYGYTITPGEKVDDALVVANHGDEALDLGVYAADGYTTDSGQFDILAADQKSRNLGLWAVPKDDRVVVQPGQSVELPFTVSVPKNATPGDYVGGIVTSLVQPDADQGINVDRRLGVKMSVRVGGDLTPSLAIESGSVSYGGGLNPFAGGDATVQYTLHNTGNAVLSAHQEVTLTGPFGWFPVSLGEIAEPPQLLPGDSWDVKLTGHDVPAVFALFGTVKVTPLVVDAAKSTTPLADVEQTVVGQAVPWTLLVVILVIAALVVLLLRRRRRVVAVAKSREDERVAEAVEKALAAEKAKKGVAEDADASEKKPEAVPVGSVKD
ncbi:WxL protein peptidoglycan domain-containing protein [Schumannella soli]|uniref:DUF916 domain-containing protein n=1 Tax=Schumannella soli TaxID=2590779 RepID=A0A506Y7A6_9MICO|nr:DUF916 domain-containing protein [Schumannella soli]TPW77733.1 DUF916 domain-containing protein [Schumannella soli]